jgi:hypothetical protein
VPICGGGGGWWKKLLCDGGGGVVASERFGYAVELPVLAPASGECRWCTVARRPSLALY